MSSQLSSFIRKVASRWPVGLVIALAFVAGFWFRPAPTGPDGTGAPSVESIAEQETIWTCPMHLHIRRSEPGLCPVCAMDLVPQSNVQETTMGERTFTTSAEAAALMNIQTAAVERRFVPMTIRMTGMVEYDETKLSHITAWVPGRLDRLYVDYTGVTVQEGDHMVELYSPELLTAQAELRRAAEAVRTLRAESPASLRRTAQTTLDASRRKLGLWGLTDEQIAAVESRGVVSDQVTIYAPTGGTVVELEGQQGMYVETGSNIYTIADLSEVWVKLDAYESDLTWLHFGQDVVFTTEAWPGEDFHGRVAFIDPVLDRDTRTVKVRVNVANEEGQLKPGMFVRAEVRAQVATNNRVMNPELAGKWIGPMHPQVVKDGPGECDICGMDLVPAESLGFVSSMADESAMPLVIPATAPLLTGKRAVVYVQLEGAESPTFEGREIVLGPRAGDYYLVESGLEVGERVVTNGAFKIDSALEIMARPSMMSPEGGGGAAHDHGTMEPGETMSGAMVAPEVSLDASLLGEVFAGYEGIHRALAADSRDAVAESGRRLLEALEKAPGNGALASARAVVEAESLASQRVAFENLSRVLIPAFANAELGAGEPVYVVHCPMAFEGRGADWMQRTDEISNPYMGEAMPTCGTVERMLLDEHGHAAHGGLR